MKTDIPSRRCFPMSFRDFTLSFRNLSLSFRRKPESSQTSSLAERTLDWIPRSSRGMTKPMGGMTELGEGMAKLRGFTLLEVMIALLVITLGMAAVINTTSESGCTIDVVSTASHPLTS